MLCSLGENKIRKIWNKKVVSKIRISSRLSQGMLLQIMVVNYDLEFVNRFGAYLNQQLYNTDTKAIEYDLVELDKMFSPYSSLTCINPLTIRDGSLGGSFPPPLALPVDYKPFLRLFRSYL